MKLQKIALGAAMAALLALAAGTQADPTPGTGTVSGKVNLPDGKPAAGATVSLILFDSAKKPTADKPDKKKGDAANTLKATADSDGKFKIENVPAGPYNIRATLKGVGSVKSPVTVKAGEEFSINVQLKPMRKKA